MASGLKWFRVACDMHSNAKISSLTDAEFRVLTFLWSLAQRSSDPGLVQHIDPYRVVASSGAKHCGCCGGPDEQSPLQIFEHLAQLGLIEHDGDTVRVHDWLEHNPAAYPSLKPEARAAQKRKERAKLADVATMSQATDPDVARVDQIRLDQEKKKKEKEQKPSAALRARLVPAGATVSTRKAYLEAYEKRWGALPVADENGNGKMNGQLARLVKQLGEEESPHVAAYFLTTNDALYVRAKHPTDLLLRDAGKLRAEWAGAPRSTATEARQTDKTEANAQGWGRLLKGAGNGVE